MTEFRNNRVQKFTTEGKLLGVLESPEMPGGIAVNRNGDVYVAHLLSGIISVYDRAGRKVREWGKAGTGDGEFQQPGGIAIGRDGSVYIADQVNRRVQRFTPEGKFLMKWGEYGTGPGQFGGNQPRTSRVGGPQFVAVDRKGNFYTTEGSVGRVQKFTADGRFLLQWGDNGTQPGGFGGRPANLPGPIGICLDRQGRVWVSATNNLVQQFTDDGRYLQGFGARGTGPGEFMTPHGLVVDRRGHLYVVDAQNCRIQKFAI